MTYSASSPLLGTGTATAAAIDAWFAAHGGPLPGGGLGASFIHWASFAGLNADLVAAQCAHETGFWTSAWAQISKNPAGLGVTGAPGAGLGFATADDGIKAQCAHLLTYILGAQSPMVADDPRYTVTPDARMGLVKTLGDLDGTWAVPGVGYGASIATLANELVAFAATQGGSPVAEPTSIGGIPVVWIPAAAGNFDTNRTGHDLVIVHDIEGTASSAINTFQVVGRQASVQFVLDPLQGRIVQMVSCDAVAYGCGNYADNQRASQFEMPGFVGQPYDPSVIDQAVAVTAYLCQRDSIPVVRLSLADVVAGKPGICGHQDIPDPSNPALGGGADHHTDPGPTFPWDSFIARVSAQVSGVAATPTSPAADPPLPTPDLQEWTDPATGYTVAGGMLARFKQIQQALSSISPGEVLLVVGHPVSGEIPVPGGVEQRFEHVDWRFVKGQSPERFDILAVT
ncbi:MAG TPA: N-acetylmuramoyl-L-alanine amidase, partial [Thermomicrobiaceae bacterium]|nr:N-acetylmuramoyl-L-alanine amidase [Thermomicrobiaceae bacterium]